MKTFTLICPDPDCAEEFDIELEPATDLTDNSDLIECPACLEEWEWEYGAEADTLTLLPDEEFDETDLTDESGDEDPDE